MQRHQLNEIEWLEFELLSDLPKVKHAVFLRQGGISQGPYASLNTGLHLQDNSEHVQNNLQLIQNQLRTEVPNWSHFVYGKGIHGKSISLVDQKSPQELIDYDGIMTAIPSLSLMMKHADCQVALFYDPKNHAAANIHAGWRGNVANIYRDAVQRMKGEFNSHPANLLVCISPSLGPDRSEFINYRTELPEEFWTFQVRPTYFDLWAIAEYQLQEAGILPHHIEVARLCTFSNSHDFFSHRRDKITGRHATCITLL
jgi:purine-nucleoside/S-methyl-5'-thioadenosine phosphorylase / adenosine deaminase